jgi:hypothetical protein
VTPAAVHPGSNPPVSKAKAAPETQTPPKPSGYGLPCSKCRTYYTADLPACPVCKNKERVSPTASPVRTTVSSVEQNLPDPAALEEERERFLREFQTQVLASQSTGNPAAGAVRCLRGENHPEGNEPAAICQSCYDQLQDRVDVLEAALHIDTKEAAQIVYDAVWADPSDTDKTYQNAAGALLAELRKRSGVTPTFRPLQSLMD